MSNKLKDKELKEKLGNTSLKDLKPEDVISYFGTDNILDSVVEKDIANYLEWNSHILDYMDKDILFDSVDEEYMLKNIYKENMVEYLENNGYEVRVPGESLDTLETLEEICRELKPRGYLDKEEAKSLLCDYLDTWMTTVF